MNDSHITARIGWLSVILSKHRVRLDDLLSRLRGIAASARCSLGLHRKFMRLLEQVQIEHEKELGILNEIEAVEKRHELRRKQKLLRRADARLAADRQPSCQQTAPAPAQEGEPQPSRLSAWKILALFYLFSKSAKTNKNQSLNNQ